MAVMQFFPVANGPAIQAAPGATSSTAEIVLGRNRVFMIVGTVALNIKFGNSGMSAAAATDMLIPANVPVIWDMGQQQDRIRVFTTASGLISIQPLSKS